MQWWIRRACSKTRISWYLCETFIYTITIATRYKWGPLQPGSWQTNVQLTQWSRDVVIRHMHEEKIIPLPNFGKLKMMWVARTQGEDLPLFWQNFPQSRKTARGERQEEGQNTLSTVIFALLKLFCRYFPGCSRPLTKQYTASLCSPCCHQYGKLGLYIAQVLISVLLLQSNPFSRQLRVRSVFCPFMSTSQWPSSIPWV